MGSKAPAKTQYRAIGDNNLWAPVAWTRFPWTGILAISGAHLGIAVCVAMLVISDGAEATACTYQPTLYLSIAYTLTNMCLSAAFDRGVIINWWRKALGPKTTV